MLREIRKRKDGVCQKLEGRQAGGFKVPCADPPSDGFLWHVNKIHSPYGSFHDLVGSDPHPHFRLLCPQVTKPKLYCPA